MIMLLSLNFFQVPVPRTRSEIEAQPESSNTSPVKGKTHLRPSSAPPGKASLDEMCVPSVPPRPASALSRTTRPSTATSRSSRPSTAGRSRLQELPEDGIPDDISDEDDVGSQRFKRIERLRIEQGKNLYHIVREEQELEKERLRMLSAVQPKKVGHLNRYAISFTYKHFYTHRTIPAVGPATEVLITRKYSTYLSNSEQIY